ncbi:hypothetical protein M0R45_027686 [Rubus argutus]|uniref:Uncharacterized protein n=1 Tax=Rubus argutus TaxID=59490 RepID=A0AAW1X2R9_RUBAR
MAGLGELGHRLCCAGLHGKEAGIYDVVCGMASLGRHGGGRNWVVGAIVKLSYGFTLVEVQKSSRFVKRCGNDDCFP